MARLRGGDDAAAAAVFHSFASRLIALARDQLDGWMRPKVDPEDIVQSVFRSFFHRFQGGDWDFVSWDSLWGLLTLVTLRKCSNWSAYLRRDCRDGRREVTVGDCSNSPWEPLDPAPSPEEAAALTEAVEQLLRGLDAPERAVIELTLQGHSAEDIAEQLGRAARSVRRVREKVRQWLESWASGPPPPRG
jgi:RNA polymerase sigma-70 factor (ECF subfamily)